MAATTTPILWDCYRQLSGAEGLGACLEYYDTSAQSLYLAGGIQTRTGNVEDGHWSEQELGDEIEISDEVYEATAWDHPFTGLLVGCGDQDGELWFFRYYYAMELSPYLQNGSWTARNDSKVTQLSLTLKNPGEGVVVGESSLFEPGARLRLSVAMGDSAPYAIGVAYLDEVDYDPYAETFPLSGRNAIGYRLLQQTFDSNTTFAGTGKEVVEWIFSLGGITRYIVGPSDYSTTWTFEPDETLWDGLIKVTQFFGGGWDVEELADGRLIVGYPHWRASYQHNSVYQFHGGTEVIKRRTTKNADGAYAHVRVTGKNAAGQELTPVYIAVNNWSRWELGSLKTKHVQAADGLTQEQLQAYAEQLAAELQYVGVGETFDGPLRPQLLVGDVASITYDGDTSTDLGLINSIEHRFGENGFFTSFSADSGGAAVTQTGYVATRSASVSGYNRRQDLADLIGVISGRGARTTIISIAPAPTPEPEGDGEEDGE